ncbi:outer membrane protein assembly factor BamD [Sinomicrobium weinanense]|uniref:Outer membrane protein assembly factor BamD n=1 Tax=Sinomicrobium weinanense TaxID=2842200 RepID=A0A926JPZ6_9FLAO|nr:outer membrane protein assembly factor BamD [Sinomicrobium weinanense]MBC9795335.1 outer membrane protein assembly factor BamD [Sinomicrobium weinanense]MBU3122950.1 outer membrane protein assembly factor BamD [Sinomicrobium weinanense]
MKRFVYIAVTAALLSSCSEFQKALKSEDVKLKYDLAEKLYNKGDYKKANRLFEQIVPQYAGKPQGERVVYFHADSYYQTKEYYLAAYQFERFSKSYPKSDKAEEAAFLGAKSYYMLSPKFSVDQTETNTGLDKLQLFINTYPDSEYIDEANKLTQELRTKLEKKDLEIAKQYNRIRYYEAAIKSFDNFLSNYPGTVFREDAMYYKMEASYNLAVNSVYAKMEERLNNTKDAYNTLKRYYPETKYADKTEKMIAVVEKELQQFSK